MSMSYQEIMAILEDERDKELECAKKSNELLRKTVNPFKRIQHKRSFDMFMDHAIGIRLAIRRIEREEGR